MWVCSVMCIHDVGIEFQNFSSSNINAGLTVLQVLKNLELYTPQKNGSYNSRFFAPRVTEFSLCK